jgi:hypothetical protein
MPLQQLGRLLSDTVPWNTFSTNRAAATPSKAALGSGNEAISLSHEKETGMDVLQIAKRVRGRYIWTAAKLLLRRPIKINTDVAYISSHPRPC